METTLGQALLAIDVEPFTLCGNNKSGYVIRDTHDFSHRVETHKTLRGILEELAKRQETLYGIPLGEPYGIDWHIRNIAGSSQPVDNKRRYSNKRRITL